MLKKSSLKCLFLILTLLITTKGFTLDKPLPEFKDVKLETQKYIDYFYSLKLSPTEQKTLEQALKPIPAPCCADNSALTC
ncbi:hypothetical protein THC_1713 [Caldimicrobium thiodismutans]|uniref:Uncharacterized protein n=1 Tax=Caldimicrobium thiodismutans TaxID=1653476 RepID=A0A0U5B1V3_9BACT|nr:hypothetical protein [Caldimicrobium thiodismutans]BAU24073.1 hypothetical protein THC_1713 [Caldimicrobium thiodismutans]